MTEPVRALILDDDPTESDSLADLLNTGDDLEVTTTQPMQKIDETAEAVLRELPDGETRLLLLDYRLEDDREQDKPVQFRGGTVAGHLRDVDPELPIVLLTSEQKLHDWVERRPGMKQVFDWTLVKSEISDVDGAAVGHAKIVDFARAWEQARGWPDNPEELWDRIAGLMKAPNDSIRLFRELEAEPPRGDVTGDVLHWLMNALSVPGPLLARDAVRVTLGVSRESLDDEGVGSWLEDASYEGALGAFGDRWWAHLVRAKLADACGGTRPLDASARAAGLSKGIGHELTAELCNWCGGERTLEACLVCGDATDAAHCVRPLTTPLPAWADPWVVCYRCIATGRADAYHVRFPPAATEVAEGLREGRIEPPVS